VSSSDLILFLVLLVLLVAATYRNLRTGLTRDAITWPGIALGLVPNAILLHRFWLSMGLPRSDRQFL